MGDTGSVWQRWLDFRQRQRAQLTEESESAAEDGAGEGSVIPAPTPAPPTPGSAHPPAGSPLNRSSPFYLGLVGGLGVLIAYGLWQMLATLDTVLTLLVVALFLALALNPLVERLVAAGVRRGRAVAIVAGLVVLVVGLIGLVVVPPVVQQGGDPVSYTHLTLPTSDLV